MNYLLDDKQVGILGTMSSSIERNPARTREAILDAGERLFAEKGFEATSLNEVGAQAGVSRGTPGYFFGSKASLYQAVLERCFDRVRSAVRSGRDRAIASRESPEVVLAGAVGEYFDFFVSNPNFVRLIEWEALSGARQLQDLPPHMQAAREAVEAMAAELGFPPSRAGEATQLVLSIIALCWFPMVHGSTLGAALGVSPADPGFMEERKRHVVQLVLHGIRGAGAADSPVQGRRAGTALV